MSAPVPPAEAASLPLKTGEVASKVPAPTAAFIQDPMKLMTYDMIDRITKYVSGEIQGTP